MSFGLRGDTRGVDVEVWVVGVIAGHGASLGSRFWPSRRIKSMTAEIARINNAVTPAKASPTSIVAFVTSAPVVAFGWSTKE